MSDLVQAAGVATPVTWNGVTWLFSPLTHRSFAAMQSQYKGERLSVALDAVSKFPAHLQAEATRAVMGDLMNDAGFDAWMRSPNGIGMMAVEMLKKHHPEIKTPEQALNAIGDMPPEMLSEVLEKTSGVVEAKN